jgi:vacuolar protein sorting-associated protein 13A/C
MLERLVSDLLVRVLGQYVHGITPETVRVGVWSGDLELHQLALRPDALAVLFETLGLDLPVTVSAGFIGTLSLKVPWKAMRSSPVLLSVKDLSLVASPVSDGDQEALAQREARLKAARLDTDDAVREARLSVDAATNEAATEQQLNTGKAPGSSQLDSSRLTRWRRRVTDSIVSIVVNNIQVDVENVVVQYQDASSVRSRPYTVSLAVESIRAVSTNKLWEEAFITENDAEAIYKVLQLKALVANWEPGIGDTSHADLTPSEWSSSIRKAGRRFIHPLDGDLRIALATSHTTPVRTRSPRVQMDLCAPDVRLCFDEFQYHTLLSTIMYLSDIDRKVRPKSAKGRWLWALECLRGLKNVMKRVCG